MNKILYISFLRHVFLPAKLELFVKKVYQTSKKFGKLIICFEVGWRMYQNKPLTLTKTISPIFLPLLQFVLHLPQKRII